MSDEQRVRVYNKDGEPEDLVLRTKSGRVLTEDDLRALSEEAERGYDLTGPGKPATRNGLLATTDAHIWAEEFCRIFNGKVVTSEESAGVDQATMVTWFANAIETGALRPKPIHLGTWHAFLHFFHMDRANASMHCSTVRYSPITFRLAEFIWAEYTYPFSPHPEHPDTLLANDSRLIDVIEHSGRYEEDAGR